MTVSLVTIKGTDCKTMELGQVADTTGGQVTKELSLCCNEEHGTSVEGVCKCLCTYGSVMLIPISSISLFHLFLYFIYFSISSLSSCIGDNR